MAPCHKRGKSAIATWAGMGSVPTALFSLCPGGHGIGQGKTGPREVALVELTQVHDWRASTGMSADYERMLASIGSEDFGSTVRDSIMALTAGARRVYLFEAAGREQNDLQYSFCEPAVAELFSAYNRWYQPLDPVCDAYKAVSRDNEVAILRIRPDDIASSAFRRQFYDDRGIVERLSIIQRGRDAWRVLSVARHRSDGYFSDEEVGVILGLACLALPMLPLNRGSPIRPRKLGVSQLEERFADRYPDLTLRQRQVCARAAVGMTVEATALDLGIAKTSVLTYRQRAYQRLGVTSPIELRALVTH
jgi:DNA-binding CsgD family transcriptional regulator